METIGQIKNITYDIQTRLYEVTFLVSTQQINQLEEMQGLKLNLNVKRYYKKRSKDSNAYLWELLGKLSEIMQLPTIEIYKNAISDLNTYYVLPIADRAVQSFIQNWEHNGKGWFCETFKSKITGYTNVRAYYGSSQFDNKQMKMLLDHVIADCKALGIETMTPDELERLRNAEQNEKNTNITTS